MLSGFPTRLDAADARSVVLARNARSVACRPRGSLASRPTRMCARCGAARLRLAAATLGLG